MNQEPKLVLYIAMSLDGYIAKDDDDLGFLSIVEQQGEDYGYSEFLKTVDTIIIGRRTFDKVQQMGFAYPPANQTAYVITKRAEKSTDNLIFYTEDLKNLVEKLKQNQTKNIYCDGGAQIVHLLLSNNLIDEIIVSIIPILLGGGIPLFQKGRNEQLLELIDVKKFDKGLVQIHYRKKS